MRLVNRRSCLSGSMFNCETIDWQPGFWPELNLVRSLIDLHQTTMAINCDMEMNIVSGLVRGWTSPSSV